MSGRCDTVRGRERRLKGGEEVREDAHARRAENARRGKKIETVERRNKKR